MKNEKYTKDYKMISGSKLLYSRFLSTSLYFAGVKVESDIDLLFRNNNDCIDEEKLGFDYYFFFLRERANYNKFHFFSERVFKRMSEHLRLQFEDSNPDFLPRWIHDGETIVVRRAAK